MRILVVEDDPTVATLLERGLREAGHEPFRAASVRAALRATAERSWDVVVLDRMLPDGDGLEVCRALRTAGSPAGVLMLTARDAVADRIAGLDSGADDYLAKPFSLDELLARIRALGRRGQAPGSTRLRLGELSLDVARQEVRRGDRSIELTARELRLLEVLMRSPGRILTKEQLREQVWGVDSEVTTAAIETYVHYLREKIDRGTDRPLIRTVRGVGYTLRQ